MLPQTLFWLPSLKLHLQRNGKMATRADTHWICYRLWCPVYQHTVYPKKYAHGFVVLCFVVVMQSFIMNSHKVFIHIHQGCFAGTGAIVRLPQCQWSKPDGYGKISQCITTTKHSKAKTVCIFLGIYCSLTLIPARISNYMATNVWCEIIYQFSNSNDATVEIWKWICNFIAHFMIAVITYPCWD